jgi:chaperonin GroES
MQFRPLHDRVVVRRIDAEEKSKGGIIIPDTAKEKPQEGEVIARRSRCPRRGRQGQPLDVKAGDRVLFGKWSGTEVRIDGEDLLIMKESDIMGESNRTAARKKAPDRLPSVPHSIYRRQAHGAKDVRFSTDARDKMLRGVEILNQRREGHARAQGRNVVIGEVVRGLPGSPRTASPSPRRTSSSDKFENMGAQMVARGGQQRPRRLRATAPPPPPSRRLHRPRGREVGRGRHEPDGPQARHRPRGHGRS